MVTTHGFCFEIWGRNRKALVCARKGCPTYHRFSVQKGFQNGVWAFRIFPPFNFVNKPFFGVKGWLLSWSSMKPKNWRSKCSSPKGYLHGFYTPACGSLITSWVSLCAVQSGFCTSKGPSPSACSLHRLLGFLFFDLAYSFFFVFTLGFVPPFPRPYFGIVALAQTILTLSFHLSQCPMAAFAPAEAAPSGEFRELLSWKTGRGLKRWCLEDPHFYPMPTLQFDCSRPFSKVPFRVAGTPLARCNE